MTERTGACLCGAVSFRATDVQTEVGVCHCGMCRRWVGGPFIASTVRNAKFEGAEHVEVFKSSDWAERAFCEECGSPLWYRVTAPGAMHGQTQMAAGLFDNAAGGELKLEVFIDKKPEGYAFEGERRQMTEAEVMAMYSQSEQGDSQ